MARKVRPRSSFRENITLIGQILPWRLFLLIPFLLVFAVPAFLLGTSAGRHILPNLSNVFYKLSNPTVTADPTPMPAFVSVLPQPGGINYAIQDGDSCDGILAIQMRMMRSSEIFSDANPQTVQALNSALGQNCGKLQPGDIVTLMPQYPLVAVGGIVEQVNALSPAQPIPTPLIHVQREQQVGVDCSNGCRLTVKIAENTQVKLSVQTGIPVPVGAWVWAQATYPRKAVSNFNNYPYADSESSLNGASLVACDLQINDTHDDQSVSCSNLQPNTIRDDGGAWLYGVTGHGALDHWNYHLSLPAGTQVMLWLSLGNNGNLSYHSGNPLYRYDAAQHLYIKV